MQWTLVWVNSGSWWWTGMPGVLQSMGPQRIGHNWVTELNLPLFTYELHITMISFKVQGSFKKNLFKHTSSHFNKCQFLRQGSYYPCLQQEIIEIWYFAQGKTNKIDENYYAHEISLQDSLLCWGVLPRLCHTWTWFVFQWLDLTLPHSVVSIFHSVTLRSLTKGLRTPCDCWDGQGLGPDVNYMHRYMYLSPPFMPIWSRVLISCLMPSTAQIVSRHCSQAQK